MPSRASPGHRRVEGRGIAKKGISNDAQSEGPDLLLEFFHVLERDDELGVTTTGAELAEAFVSDNEIGGCLVPAVEETGFPHVSQGSPPFASAFKKMDDGRGDRLIAAGF